MVYTIGPRLVPTEMRDNELSDGTRIRYVPGTVPLSSRTLIRWLKHLRMSKGTFSPPPETVGRCLYLTPSCTGPSQVHLVPSVLSRVVYHV